MSVRFNPPPSWQQYLPANFQPSTAWIPDTAWGAPPAGWPMWVHTDSGYPAAPPEEYRNNPYLFISVMPGMPAQPAPAQSVPVHSTATPGKNVPSPAKFTHSTRAASPAQPSGDKKPMGKGTKTTLWIVGIIAFLSIVGACSEGGDKETAAPAATPSASATQPAANESPAAAAVVAEPTEEPEPEVSEEPEPEPEPKVLVPAGQQSFSDRVEKARKDYEATDNELRMSKVVTDRDKALCKATGGSFKGWKATVNDVGSTGDGYGYVAVIIEDDIELSTWNNALSDVFDNTLIKPENKLFDTLLDLSSGDIVTVSGSFTDGKDTCVQTSNLTEVFNADSPDFKVKFTSIKVG